MGNEQLEAGNMAGENRRLQLIGPNGTIAGAMYSTETCERSVESAREAAG